MLDYESIVPLYEQIVSELKEDISGGRFAAQKRLPTEDELSEQYQVSRITIRRAVAELVKDGLVEKKQGKGTFVCAPKLHKALKQPGMSFTEVCAMNGMKASAKIISMGIIRPEDPMVLKYLGLEKGEPAVQMIRLRLADDQPMVVENNCFPLEYSYLLGVDLEHDSLYRYLREEKNVEIVAGDLTLKIVRTDSSTSKLLQVPRNTPMLRMTGCTRSGDGRMLHTIQNIGYGENFDFIVR